MPAENFAHAALLLVGHGSSVNEDSSAAVHRYAEEFRRRRVFAEVHARFWKEPPLVTDALAGVASTRVFAVPCFMSEGYFTEHAIPLALGLRVSEAEDFPRVQQLGRHQVHYTRPVGTHPGMTEVLLARAREAMEGHPASPPAQPGQTALFLAGHGTPRHPRSREAVEDHAARIRALNLFAEVHAVFMEEAPRIAEVLHLTRLPFLTVVPFFLSDGLHSREDIPVLLGEPESTVRERLQARQPTWINPARRGGRFLWLTPAAGTAQGVADVILERVQEAATTPPRAP